MSSCDQKNLINGSESDKIKAIRMGFMPKSDEEIFDKAFYEAYPHLFTYDGKDPNWLSNTSTNNNMHHLRKCDCAMNILMSVGCQCGGK